MLTLFSCENVFKFVSFLLYPVEVKILKCAMLEAFIIVVLAACLCTLYMYVFSNWIFFGS